MVNPPHGCVVKLVAIGLTGVCYWNFFADPHLKVKWDEERGMGVGAAVWDCETRSSYCAERKTAGLVAFLCLWLLLFRRPCHGLLWGLVPCRCVHHCCVSVLLIGKVDLEVFYVERNAGL